MGEAISVWRTRAAPSPVVSSEASPVACGNVCQGPRAPCCERCMCIQVRLPCWLWRGDDSASEALIRREGGPHTPAPTAKQACGLTVHAFSCGERPRVAGRQATIRVLCDRGSWGCSRRTALSRG
eukprot:3290446-Alexandrium_andersonii.AAC.1